LGSAPTYNLEYSSQPSRHVTTYHFYYRCMLESTTNCPSTKGCDFPIIHVRGHGAEFSTIQRATNGMGARLGSKALAAFLTISRAHERINCGELTTTQHQTWRNHLRERVPVGRSRSRCSAGVLLPERLVGLVGLWSFWYRPLHGIVGGNK
jgi:hypothetical protein